jgi:2-keto-4-pentenoate hydratase/2-oxohepta-3-ene-1,7-dioic acid hydratase in catechol pathway
VVPIPLMAVGRNYREHAAEHGNEVPAEPILFFKPSTSVIGPGDAIVLPELSERVEHEAELAVVIGRLVREVPIERALDAVLGYTCANDVTARDLQRTDNQWTRAKGFDTFCPLGPWITTDPAALDALIECRVNQRTTQSARTSEMVYGVPELIAYVSAVMTLLPGDVILTGTPAGVSQLTEGDTVSVSIEGIGALENRVVGP